MRLITFFLFFALSQTWGFGQQISVVTLLEDSIQESSGLIYLEQELITHNDSGGDAALFELDSVTGNVKRTVIIDNAINVDWEDICHDDNYIYIGDFGNNGGTRTDLKVLRLPIVDYINTPNDTVLSDVIDFSFADQNDFTPSVFSTNFDAEAMIAYNDSLYIFTKNWGNDSTNVYSLPKTPGYYEIEKVDSFNTDGLVTGATYNPTTSSIVLTGYKGITPFIIEVSDFISNEFSSGTIERTVLDPPNNHSVQIEGITFINESEYFITAETNITGDPTLYKLDMDDVTAVHGIENEMLLIYPNPASKFIQIKSSDEFFIRIYDSKGGVHIETTAKKIDVSCLKKGIYTILIEDYTGKVSIKKLSIN